MKIALIGDFGARLDEGMRKLCAQIETAARERHEVLTVQTKDFCVGRAWASLRRFRPDCLHYLTGPTWVSLAALALQRRLLSGRPRTVVTGVRPFLGTTARRGLRLMAPHVFLAQARQWERLLANVDVATMDFPNWTDLGRFQPVDARHRAALRAEFGLPDERRLLLHVGHVKANRNLSALVAAQRSGRYQVWVVGSESESRPGPWRRELEEAGVRVDSRYFPAIEKIYQAADVYVFTVRATPAGQFPRSYNEIGVIDMPLSVLEARACGLPVLSTRHDALQHFLAGDPAMHWFDGTGDDCLARLDEMRAVAGACGRLDDRFDQRHLAERLERVYRSAVFPA